MAPRANRRADLRFAVRILGREPGFSAVIVITLALGIGPDTAIFTVVRAALLRPLPYANPADLVTWSGNESLLDVVDIRAQAHELFSSGGAVNPETMDYTSDAEPPVVCAGFAENGFFDVLGIPAMLGRTLSAHVGVVPEGFAAPEFNPGCFGRAESRVSRGRHVPWRSFYGDVLAPEA